MCNRNQGRHASKGNAGADKGGGGERVGGSTMLGFNTVVGAVGIVADAIAVDVPGLVLEAVAHLATLVEKSASR